MLSLPHAGGFAIPAHASVTSFSSSVSSLKVLSLFSGGGGLDIAASREGLEIVESHEWDTSACDAYQRATGLGIQQTDLKAIDPRTLPDADMIIGGPPCQEFSQGNVLGSIDGAKNLWPATIEIVRVKRPAMFLFENVTGLVYKYTLYFNWIVDQFKDMGYRVETRILNAADYGVPQTRQRVIVVGRLDNQAWNWPAPTHSKAGGLFTSQWVSWREALPYGWEATAEASTLPTWTHRSKYQHIPANALVNAKDMIKNRLHRDVNEPAFTLTTECLKRVYIVLEGIVYRANTLAMTRLQTLPDVDMPSHVIGNAVPPLLGQALFRAMKEEV